MNEVLTYDLLSSLVSAIVPIACGCVLPIIIVWLVVRQQMNENNSRTQILTTAIEKNPEIDVEELIRKIKPKEKPLKEKLLSKLLWGSVASISGIGLTVVGLLDDMTFLYFGVILLAVGVAFMINYYVGKRMLSKEIEAEENRMTFKE